MRHQYIVDTCYTRRWFGLHLFSLKRTVCVCRIYCPPNVWRGDITGRCISRFSFSSSTSRFWVSDMKRPTLNSDFYLQFQLVLLTSSLDLRTKPSTRSCNIIQSTWHTMKSTSRIVSSMRVTPVSRTKEMGTFAVTWKERRHWTDCVLKHLQSSSWKMDAVFPRIEPVVSVGIVLLTDDQNVSGSESFLSLKDWKVLRVMIEEFWLCLRLWTSSIELINNGGCIHFSSFQQVLSFDYVWRQTDGR